MIKAENKGRFSVGGRQVTHGKWRSSEYNSWDNMIQRCFNPNKKTHRYYGAKGVTVCEKWRKFIGFYEDMGSKPTPKHSLDRIDPFGNYEPGNCRWATRKEQDSNTRRSKK